MRLYPHGCGSRPMSAENVLSYPLLVRPGTEPARAIASRAKHKVVPLKDWPEQEPHTIEQLRQWVRSAIVRYGKQSRILYITIVWRNHYTGPDSTPFSDRAPFLVDCASGTR